MIEETIDLVLSRQVPSSGDNLSSFVMDCDHFFSQPEEVLREADVKATGDPRSMVSVTVTLAEQLMSIQRVNEALHIGIGDSFGSIEPGRSRNLPPGPTGRQNIAQGFGRRPMPWESRRQDIAA